MSFSNLQGARLRGTDLRRARLRGAKLTEADFSGADLLDANLEETDIGLEISNLLDSEELEENFSKNSEDFCSNVFNREIGEGCFTFKIVKVTQDELNEYQSDKEDFKRMEKEYDKEWDD